MTHLYALEDAHLEQPSLVAIGVFDGVHVGHQYLIKQLIRRAYATGKLAVVLTFFPHPDAVLKGITGRYYLTSPEQRAEQLLNLGVDVVVTHPFNDDVRQMRAETFVDRLLKHLNMVGVWVGEDFALGYEREGNVAFLRQKGLEKGFTLETIELITARGNQSVVSSTDIRALLKGGQVEEACRFLGRGYQVEGTVVLGEQRGRTIGFPTANLSVWSEQLIPANGVYAGWAIVRGERYMAVTNIGTRPTFDGQDVRVEPHLLNFNGDIYGATMRLTLETRLRSERKFDGIEALKTQLALDIEAGRMFLTAQEEKASKLLKPSMRWM